MSELPRRIVSRLRRYIGNRRRMKRARVRLAFTLSLADSRMSSNGSRRLASLEGHTLDVSTDGVALVVPAIRIGEQYLVGNERKLNLKLDLAGDPIELKVVPVRYESLEEDAADSGYVIGARITEISDNDRVRLDEFVSGWFAKQAGG